MPRPDKFHFAFLTGTGLAYVSGSLAFLAAGILRGELIATVSGVTLLSFAAFSCLTVLFTQLLWRHASVAADWKEPGIFRIIPGSTKKVPFRSLFFSEVLYCLDYSTSGTAGTGRRFSVSVPVTGPACDHALELPPRGIYTASNPRLCIRDYAGFFTFTVPLPGSDLPAPLIVHPAAQTEPKTGFPPGKTGRTRGKSSFKRSDDLYETRNYQPGDDPRKINWKVYAHSGELSIRQGELLPPPADEYVFVLCGRMPVTPSPDDKNRYDLLLARAARLAALLLSTNRSVTVVSADAENRRCRTAVHPSDTGAEETAERAFSVPQLDTEALTADQLLAAVPEEATCLCFVLPAQLSAGTLPRPAAGSTTVYIGPVPEPSVTRTFARKLLDLLFMPPSDRTPSGLREAGNGLENAEAHLKKEGFNVKTI